MQMNRPSASARVSQGPAASENPPQQQQQLHSDGITASALSSGQQIAALQSGDGTASPTAAHGRVRKTSSSSALVCQVVGCGQNLSALREYYQRYKICHTHREMDQMQGPDGEWQRFCQQCGRFHSLTAFDDNKRSCRERLARHNERRRRRPLGEPSSTSLPAGSNKAASSIDVDTYTHCATYGNAFSVDGSWGQRITGLSATAFAQQPLSIWEQRHLHMQALQMQELEHRVLSSGANALHQQQHQHLDVSSLSAPYNVINSNTSAPFNSSAAFSVLHSNTSDFSSDLSSQYSLLSADGSTAGVQLLAGPRGLPHILATGGEEQLHALYAAATPSAYAAIQTLAPTSGLAGPSSASAEWAQRKTLSWPLAQLKVEHAAVEQQQHSMLNGARGSFMPATHPLCEGSLAIMRSVGTGGPCLHVPGNAAPSVSHTLHSSQPQAVRLTSSTSLQQEIRVLGENQTLDSIWEHIMLVDGSADNAGGLRPLDQDSRLLMNAAE